MSSPGERLQAIAERDGVRTIAVPMERRIAPLKDLRSLWQMWRVLRRERPDMVHSITPKAGLVTMVAGWLARVPVRIHMFTGLVFPTSKGLKRLLLMATDWLTCACATHVIPEGEGVKADLLNHHITRKPIAVLGYGNIQGIDLTYFDRKVSPPKSPLKRGTSCSGSKTELPPLQGGLGGAPGYVITMIAAFREQKDQDTLIRAMALLPEGYRLQLVGDGVRRGALEALVHELGLEERVSLLGVRTDIPELMEGSDVMVLSSHWEGLSLSSIEGMASGRPFVASDVDGLREVVDGYGVMFPEGDATALAEAIEGLCSNPEHYRTVATRCQARAQQFDITQMANRYNCLY